MAASWKDLWDQSESIALHTQKGIDFLEKYGAFLKERCQIEMEYAKQLRGLGKRYFPKKREEEDYQFTYARAFLGVLQELGDIAGQHEVIAENIKNNILRDLGNTSRDLKEQRKIHLSEATQIQHELDFTIDKMYKTRRDYAKCFKEAEGAQFKYEKAEGNMDLSRAELEKTKNNAILRNQQAEDAKNSYALQLQKTNERKNEHYNKLVPAVFEKLRTMDETRIAHMQRLIRQCVEVERAVFPIMQRCLDGMLQNSDKIDPAQDSRFVVDRYRSGWMPPEDFPFEDLGAPDQHGTPSSSRANTLEGGQNGAMMNGAINGNGMVHHTTSATDLVNKVSRRSSMGKGHSKITRFFGGKKAADEFKEDYSDLPPSQRVKKLKERIVCLQKELDTKTAARDGLLKMHQCYTENPKLGDVHQVDAQLKKYSEELDALTAELQKFQNYLAEASSQEGLSISSLLNTGGPTSSVPSPSVHRGRSPGGSGPGARGSASSSTMSQPTQRSSYSEDSISSGSSMGHRDSALGKAASPKRTTDPTGAAGGRPARPVTPQQKFASTHGSSASPESGIGAEASPMSYMDGGEGSLYNECDPLPVLGTGTALYTFDGCSDGTIPMSFGDEVLLIEKDEGDGWTRIRKIGPSADEGFVPTSYLDCKFYPT